MNRFWSKWHIRKDGTAVNIVVCTRPLDGFTDASLRVPCENYVFCATFDYVLTVLLYFYFQVFLISLSETWGQFEKLSRKLLLFVTIHWWLIRFLFYRGVREPVCSDVTMTSHRRSQIWLARVISTKLESQLGQVVVLSKPYYIYFLFYTDVPDFEAHHKYS